MENIIFYVDYNGVQTEIFKDNGEPDGKHRFATFEKAQKAVAIYLNEHIANIEAAKKKILALNEQQIKDHSN